MQNQLVRVFFKARGKPCMIAFTRVYKVWKLTQLGGANRRLHIGNL